MTYDISGRSPQVAFSAWRNRFSFWNRNVPTALAFIAAAVAVGAIGWSGEVFLLPVACLFPALWAFAPTRLVASLVSMGYFMTASRGLPVGVSIFYASDMWLGLVLWIAASLSFVTVHMILWTPRSGWQVAVRYAAAVILMSVPPFGIVGWASPITAAGVLFPGWGWFGLFAAFIGLLTMTTRAWPIASAVLAGAWALSAVNWTPVGATDGWTGIDASFQYEAAGEFAGYDQQVATIGMVRRASGNGATKTVLPESALGVWTPTTERLWTSGLENLDAAVAGGAIVVNENGYYNVMIEVTGEGARILYRERMPVPVSMWLPWDIGGATAEFFGNPIGRIGETSIAPLICYEQLIVWPVPNR